VYWRPSYWWQARALSQLKVQSAENRAADTPGPLLRPELLPSTPVRQLHARRLRKYERRLRE